MNNEMMIREDEQRCCSLSTASISGGILSKPLCVYQKQSTPFNNKYGSGSQNSQTHPKTRSLAQSNASNTECRQIITRFQATSYTAVLNIFITQQCKLYIEEYSLFTFS